jgi:hypothetical protein
MNGAFFPHRAIRLAPLTIFRRLRRAPSYRVARNQRASEKTVWSLASVFKVLQ